MVKSKNKGYINLGLFLVSELPYSDGSCKKVTALSRRTGGEYQNTYAPTLVAMCDSMEIETNIEALFHQADEVAGLKAELETRKGSVRILNHSMRNGARGRLYANYGLYLPDEIFCDLMFGLNRRRTEEGASLSLAIGNRRLITEKDLDLLFAIGETYWRSRKENPANIVMCRCDITAVRSAFAYIKKDDSVRSP